MRGQYPPFSLRGRRRKAIVASGLLALAFAVAGGLSACARPLLLVLLDPLFAAAEPEAAASLSRFRPSGYAVRVHTLDPLATELDPGGADIVLASPLALTALAEGPASKLPPRLFAIDASEPEGLEGSLSIVRFDRSRAWKRAGALAAAFLAGEGEAAIVVIEGRGRSRLRTADFSEGMRGAGGESPLARVLDADSSPEDLDRTIDALLARDLRFVAISVGALNSRALRRLSAAGVVVVSDQGAREASFIVEDDYKAALEGLTTLIHVAGNGSRDILIGSRLVRGPGLEAAAARHPALLGLSKGLPRAQFR